MKNVQPADTIEGKSKNSFLAQHETFIDAARENRYRAIYCDELFDGKHDVDVTWKTTKSFLLYWKLQAMLKLSANQQFDARNSNRFDTIGVVKCSN